MSFDVSADAYRRLMERYSGPLAVAFAGEAAMRQGQRALDVGCGPGALAQLSVHFMTDPVAGLREMARLTRPGGMVAACVWDHGGGRSPVALVWRAAREFDPAAPDESGLAGVREGHLARLFADAGLAGARATALTVRARHASFEDWWEPFTHGVGPAGGYVGSLAEEPRARLRARLSELAGGPPVEISATAWTVTCRT